MLTFYVFLSLSKSVDNVICWFVCCSHFFFFLHNFNQFVAVFVTISHSEANQRAIDRPTNRSIKFDLMFFYRLLVFVSILEIVYVFQPEQDLATLFLSWGQTRFYNSHRILHSWNFSLILLLIHANNNADIGSVVTNTIRLCFRVVANFQEESKIVYVEVTNRKQSYCLTA